MKHKLTLISTPKQQKLLDKAVALHQTDLLDEAETIYQNLLLVLPKHPLLLTNLGAIALQKGHAEDAFKLLERSLLLDPNQPNAQYNCGLALQNLDRFDESITYYNQTVVMDNNYVDAFFNLGIVYYKLKRIEEALDSFNQALLMKPDYVGAYYFRGICFSELKQFDDAIENYNFVIAMDANYVDAYYMLGNAYMEMDRFDDALTSFSRTITLNPEHAEAYCNRGLILKKLYRLSDALNNYNKSLAINPDNAMIYYNRAEVFSALRHFDDTFADYDRAIKLDPFFSRAYWNKSLIKFLKGEFSEAWPLYDWRWQDDLSGHSVKLQTSRPQLNDKNKVANLFIWAEQGVGDHLFFGTLLNEAKKLADQLIVSVDKRLLPLFQRSLPDIHFIDKQQVLPESEYDYQLPIGSIGQYFRNSLDDFIHQPNAYIKADKDRSRELRKTLGGNESFICGISWQTNAKADGSTRSLSLEQLALAIASPSIKLVSLQYGDVAEDISQLQIKHGIEVAQIESVDNYNDLDGLAALIDACDLVVSIDNSTVHLAGALGKEVWILLPYECNFRWMLDRTDSPWYPSAKLFRQPISGDWGSVLANISQELTCNKSDEVASITNLTGVIVAEKDNSLIIQSNTLKVGIITPVGPGHEVAYASCLNSIVTAWQHDQGLFSEFEIIMMLDLEGDFGRSQRRNDGIDEAISKNCDWLFFIDADDLMMPDAFKNAAQYVNDYDAIFGNICEMPFGQPELAVLREGQLTTTEDFNDILLNDPYLTLKMGHFVKTKCAAEIKFDVDMNTGEDFKYYLELCQKYKFIKAPEILFINQRGNHSSGPRSANGGDWRASVESQISKIIFKVKMDVKVELTSPELTHICLGNNLYKVPSHWFWVQFANNWEPQTLKFFEYNLIKGTAVLDIGGWVGPTALIATSLGAKKITIIEPNPINFKKLLETQFGNQGLLEKWTLLNVCVSNFRGFTKIGPLEGILNSSSATNIRDQNGVEVMSVLLEDLIKVGERYSLIKIDIEGAEEFIISDLTVFLKTEAAIWLSIHPPFLKDSLTFYQKLLNLNMYFYLVNHDNKLMSWSTLENQIMSSEKNPAWGTEWGNFFEVGLLPKHIFKEDGTRF